MNHLFFNRILRQVFHHILYEQFDCVLIRLTRFLIEEVLESNLLLTISILIEDVGAETIGLEHIRPEIEHHLVDELLGRNYAFLVSLAEKETEFLVLGIYLFSEIKDLHSNFPPPYVL